MYRMVRLKTALCTLIMALPSETGRQRHMLLSCAFVCPSVTNRDLWTRCCENESILMPVGTSGPRPQARE